MLEYSMRVIGKMSFDKTEGYIRTGGGDILLNKWGIKGPYFEKERGKGIYRILIFGGSTTQGGFENELDYPRVLERMLNNKLNNKIHYQVINMGQVGKTSCHIRKKFLEYAPKFKPDMIILGTGMNDFLVSNKMRPEGKNNYCGALFEKVSILSKSHTYRLLKIKLGPSKSKVSILKREREINVSNNLEYYGSILEDIILEAKKRNIEVGLMLSPSSPDILTPAFEIKKSPPWNNPYFIKTSDIGSEIKLFQKYLIKYENIQKKLAKNHTNTFFILNNLGIHTKDKKNFFFEELHPSGPGYRIVALSIYNALNQKMKIHSNTLLENIIRPMNSNELEILFLKSLFIANQIEELNLSFCVVVHGTCNANKVPFPDLFYATHAIALSLSTILQFPDEVKREEIKNKLEGYLLKAKKRATEFSLVYWTLYLLNQSYGDMKKAGFFKEQAYKLNPLLEKFPFEKHLTYFKRINTPNPFMQSFKTLLNLEEKIKAGHFKISLSDFRYMMFKLQQSLMVNSDSQIKNINNLYYDLYISSPLLVQSLLKAWIKVLEERGFEAMALDIKNKGAKMKPEYEFNKIFKS